jgi:hypothetical protein
MNRVLEHIEQKKQELARLPLFAFTQDRGIEPLQRLGFAPCLAPMTTGFADLMAFGLRDESSEDRLQQLLNAHTSVDDRHWELFMRDLDSLGLNRTLDVNGALKLLWEEHSAKTRQLIYKLMALVHGASPILRLVILEAVEVAAAVGPPGGGRRRPGSRNSPHCWQTTRVLSMVHTRHCLTCTSVPMRHSRTAWPSAVHSPRPSAEAAHASSSTLPDRSQRMESLTSVQPEGPLHGSVRQTLSRHSRASSSLAHR